MKTKNTSNSLTRACCAVFIFGSSVATSNAAFAWTSLTYSIDNGTATTVLETDSPWDAAGTTLGTLGIGSSISGTFDANTGGDITTVNFSYAATGGDLTFQISDASSNNLNGFFRFELDPDPNVTGISYDINYVQAIQGSTNNAFVLAGVFIGNTVNDATLTYNIEDENLNPLTLNDGDVWRTANVNGTGTDFQVPDSFAANGTQAVLNVPTGAGEGLGWVREGAVPDQNVGRVYGELTADAGVLSDDLQFFMTFNGDFTDSNGILVVPEPSSVMILGLGLLGFGLRRVRR